MFFSPIAILFNFICLLAFIYGYWIRYDVDIWQTATVLLFLLQLFFIVLRVTRPLGRINMFIVASWVCFSLLTTPWDRGIFFGSAFNSFAFLVVCLYPYFQELSEGKKTYIRQWSIAESHELRNHPTVDVRLVFGAIMLSISNFMNDKQSHDLVKTNGLGSNDTDTVIAKLSSDHVLFLISCYTYAMIYLWILKEKKPKDILPKLAVNFIALFSKALDKDKKQVQEIFSQKTAYYMKCISESRNIIEIVSSDILNLYNEDRFSFHILTINILLTTWATAYMEAIVNTLEKYYEFNPEFI